MPRFITEDVEGYEVEGEEFIEGDDVEGDDVEGDDVEGDDVEGGEYNEMGASTIFDVAGYAGQDEMGRFLFFGKKKKKQQKVKAPKGGRRIVRRTTRRIVQPTPQARPPMDSRIPNVKHHGLTPTKTFPLPLTKTSATAAGQVDRVIVRPQVSLFKPTRLLLGDDIADNVNILAIYVGNKPQFSATGEIPGSAYKATSTIGAFQSEYDTATGGLDITVEFRNKSANPLTFTAVMFGSSSTASY